MAEYYFRHLIVKAGATDRIHASSAGTYADNGMPASYSSFAVLKEKYEVDMSRHQSRYLSHDLIEESDLIVVMTAGHRQSVLMKEPAAAPKVKLLLTYAGEGAYDVNDPYGADVQVYAGCFERMRPALDNLFLDLLQHAGKT